MATGKGFREIGRNAGLRAALACARASAAFGRNGLGRKGQILGIDEVSSSCSTSGVGNAARARLPACYRLSRGRLVIRDASGNGRRQHGGRQFRLERRSRGTELEYDEFPGPGAAGRRDNPSERAGAGCTERGRCGPPFHGDEYGQRNGRIRARDRQHARGRRFRPGAGCTRLYFDTDASGDLSAADVAYQAGVNDPQLAADASIVCCWSMTFRQALPMRSSDAAS